MLSMYDCYRRIGQFILTTEPCSVHIALQWRFLYAYWPRLDAIVYEWNPRQSPCQCSIQRHVSTANSELTIYCVCNLLESKRSTHFILNRQSFCPQSCLLERFIPKSAFSSHASTKSQIMWSGHCLRKGLLLVPIHKCKNVRKIRQRLSICSESDGPLFGQAPSRT